MPRPAIAFVYSMQGGPEGPAVNNKDTLDSNDTSASSLRYPIKLLTKRNLRLERKAFFDTNCLCDVGMAWFILHQGINWLFSIFLLYFFVNYVDSLEARWRKNDVVKFATPVDFTMH